MTSSDSHETPEARAEAFLRRFQDASPRARESLRSEAASLARSVHTAGVDLCHSRATEHSPRIGVLFLAAAKLEAASRAPGDETPLRFRRDVERDPAQLAEYEAFVASIAR